MAARQQKHGLARTPSPWIAKETSLSPSSATIEFGAWMQKLAESRRSRGTVCRIDRRRESSRGAFRVVFYSTMKCVIPNKHSWLMPLGRLTRKQYHWPSEHYAIVTSVVCRLHVRPVIKSARLYRSRRLPLRVIRLPPLHVPDFLARIIGIEIKLHRIGVQPHPHRASQRRLI